LVPAYLRFAPRRIPCLFTIHNLAYQGKFDASLFPLLGLPPEAIPAGGAAGSAAYLVGVFGPAFIEVLLARLRHAGKGDGDE
jgi:glycogen synthase